MILEDASGRVLLAGGGVLSGGPSINGTWWAANSPWNAPIPAGTFASPMGNSASVIAAYQAAGGNVTTAFNIANTSFTAALIVAPSLTPTGKWVYQYPNNSTSYNLPICPAGGAIGTALASAASWFAGLGDTDRSLCLYSTDTGMMYDIYPDTATSSSNPGANNTFNGGVPPVYIVTATVRPLTGSGWWNQANFTTVSSGTASGACQVGGSIKPSEWTAGVIPHALMGAYPTGSAPVDLSGGNPSSPDASAAFVFPARGSDSTFGSVAYRLPEGARLQLDPSLSDSDLTTLGVASAMLPVCHALQQYGWYCMDVDGTFSAHIKFLSTNPNTSTAGFGNGYTYTGATSLPMALMAHVAWVPGPWVAGGSGVGSGVAVTDTAGGCSYTKNYGSGDGLVHVGDIMTVYPTYNWASGAGALQGFNPSPGRGSASWWEGVSYLVSAATSGTFTLQAIGGAAITSTIGNMNVWFTTNAPFASIGTMTATPYIALGS